MELNLVLNQTMIKIICEGSKTKGFFQFQKPKNNGN